MALPKDYDADGCSLARSLEVVGERWTLLVIRDAFYGVRRFSDFAAHQAIPRAVLTHRLKALVAEGVLAVAPGPHGHDEYELTAKSVDLWPAVRSLMTWGDGYYSTKGPRRVFSHAADGGEVPAGGACAACGSAVAAPDLVVAPGSGWEPASKTDAVSAALAGPHRVLTSVRDS
jgi:DNA-binding HxlR family transcriptional regulator